MHRTLPARRARQRRLGVLGAFAAITVLSAHVALTQTTPSGSQNMSEPRRLIIIGASYARSWGQPPFANYVVTNKGVGGESSTAVAKRFERDVLSAKPDAVLIWGHVNDITQASADRYDSVKSAVRANYRQMVDAAQRAGIDVWLATEIPLAEPSGIVNALAGFVGKLRGKQSYAARVNAQVRELNDFVRALAKERGLRSLDLHSVFDRGDGIRNSDFAKEDNSHITEAGYAALTRYAVAQVATR
jgi:lysophospholipase L1-like esterase